MLTTYKNKMRYSNGLSIPNMIAAYYLRDSSLDLNSPQCVRQVMEDVIRSKSGKCVLIQKCSSLGQYVMSIFEPNGAPNIDNRIFYNLYDSTFLMEGNTDLNYLVTKLYDMYGAQIRLKRFSFTGFDQTWNELNDIERAEIQTIILSVK